jgi:hypothetical protein
MESNIFLIYILIYDTQLDLVTFPAFSNHQIQKLLDRNLILYIMNLLSYTIHYKATLFEHEMNHHFL